MRNPELSDLLRLQIAQGKIRASLEQWKVINALIHCRTAALGGHLYECMDCGNSQPQYNSCRNRHCPKCLGSETADWLEKRAKELLNVPYFHLVFTIPHELNSVVLNNKRVVLDILFKAVGSTLKAVAKRSLGGEIGFFSVLHTWGGQLQFHPHIHCVIPGVVIAPDNSVTKTRDNFFVSKRRLQVVFKAMFLKLLRKAYTENKLQLHYGGEAQSFIQILQQCAKADWIVDARKPFSHPELVLKYLARYTHRVAIMNSRIKEYDPKTNQVRFLYRDKKKGNSLHSCKLSLPEFVRRFLLHTLPHQFVRIRHYGFMASGLKTLALASLRAKLGTLPSSITKPHPPRCIFCHGENLFYRGELGATRHKHKELPHIC